MAEESRRKKGKPQRPQAPQNKGKQTPPPQAPPPRATVDDEEKDDEKDLDLDEVPEAKINEDEVVAPDGLFLTPAVKNVMEGRIRDNWDFVRDELLKPVPTEVGGVENRNAIAGGGKSWLFACTSKKEEVLGEHVIKVLIKIKPDGNAKKLKRQMKEAKNEGTVLMACRNVHPHLSSLVDADEDDDFVYYVIKKIDGDQIFRLKTAEGVLKTHHGIRLFHEMLYLLHLLHEVGYTHGDVRTNNYMTTCKFEDKTDATGDEIHAILIDFGKAEAWSAERVAKDLADFHVYFAQGMKTVSNNPRKWYKNEKWEEFVRRMQFINGTFKARHKPPDEIIDSAQKAIEVGQACGVFPGPGLQPQAVGAYDALGLRVNRFERSYDAIGAIMGGSMSDSTDGSGRSDDGHYRGGRLGKVMRENRRLRKERRRLRRQVKKALAQVVVVFLDHV